MKVLIFLLEGIAFHHLKIPPLARVAWPAQNFGRGQIFDLTPPKNLGQQQYFTSR